VCGADNPIGLRARSYKVGDAVHLPFATRREHGGWNDVTHGGFVATVLDEVMTWAAILGSEKPCFAADFNVRMLEPLSAGTSCTAIGRLVKARRRIFDLESWLEDDEGRVYARGSGRYMPVPPERARHFRDDFVAADDCLDLDHIFRAEA
jgi:acyl-coenzyme A thioesterase PaaI-like protein